ncbi:unnamed protein product [Ascophyllum nodosum]
MDLSCCNWVEFWITILSFADALTDFLYFDKLYYSDEVSQGVAFIVLPFAVFGVVGMLVGPSSQIGLMTAVLLEDVPQIIATTAIEAYLVQGRIALWTPEAKATYVFSILSLQQKFFKIGFAPSVRRPVANPERKPNPIWVFFCSLMAVVASLLVAWGVAVIVILAS